MHRPCYGKVAIAAAVYPFQLCKAILKGLVQEMKDRDRWDPAVKLVLPPGHSLKALDKDKMPEDEDGQHEQDMLNMILIIEKNKGDKFVDDLTGQVLDERLVKKARRLEMEYFKQRNVCTKVPRAEAIERIGR